MTSATRKDRILDQCYTNVQDAYTVVSLPPLGQHDHNLVQLIPLNIGFGAEGTDYYSHCQRVVKEWSADAVQNLKGSLDCTDWDVFVDSASDINELTEPVCGYVKLRVERAIPQKTVKMFPNNKP